MKKNVLTDRGFVSLWLGTAISELAGAFGTFCNSILIYDMTGSKIALGSMWLLYFLPSIILQLVSGPFIDKWSRKKIMIFSQWTRAVIFLLLLLTVVSGNIESWHVYAVQIVIGLLAPFYVPASQAITPTIVSKEQLSTANAYLDGTSRLMMFLAPVSGGIVIEYIGIKLTLLCIVVSLTISGSILLWINEQRIVKEIRSTWLEQFTEGISYFFKERRIVWLGIFLGFVQFGVGVTMVINLPYIIDVLHGNYDDYGIFMAGFPLGYVIGSLVVSKFKYKSRRMIMLGALVIGGLTYVSLGVTDSLYVAILVEIVAGIAMAFFNVHNTTINQQTVPQHLMGKVFSVRLVIIRGVMPLGVLVGGVVSELWGIRPLFILIGALISTASIIGIVLPYFKFIDVPDQVNEKEAS
ncbi:MFS transporter [Fictibacillus aquaticus]|uniref:MFS transporter n=1 Tax=Fictibacillus aquaticus TaxID=2021314 RepID=A0A235FEP1_9BACL|nr:MFS transporter [Fictibacillus aquaticus]OYD59414.1 MFS transporter [Fictibacillus aquaticus]